MLVICVPWIGFALIPGGGHNQKLSHALSTKLASFPTRRPPAKGRVANKSGAKPTFKPSRSGYKRSARVFGRKAQDVQPPRLGLKVPSVTQLEVREDTEPDDAPATRSFGVRNILGQNIVNCREFSLDSTKEFSFIDSYSSFRSIPSFPLPEIAFVGRSNVGKSSLLNTISGSSKQIAVEGKVPGRTQLINLFRCQDSEGDICIFTDLPGYGFAKVSKEKQDEISRFVNQYLGKRGSLKLTVLLVDARREPQVADIKMLQV